MQGQKFESRTTPKIEKFFFNSSFPARSMPLCGLVEMVFTFELEFSRTRSSVNFVPNFFLPKFIVKN